MELNAMRSEVDENDVVDEAVVRRKPNRKRLRSRNSVIDEWLSYEAGKTRMLIWRTSWWNSE